MAETPSFEQTVLLVQRAQADDHEALEQLFQRYLPRVRRIASLRLGTRQHQLLDVDDVTQEAMTDAFRSLTKFDVRSDATFLCWLSKLVENRIRMALRQGRAQKRGGGKERRFADAPDSLRESGLLGNLTTPSRHAIASELDEALVTALQQLSERERELIIQRFHCRMSYEEIAQELELSGADVARASYNRALAKYRSIVERLGGDEA